MNPTGRAVADAVPDVDTFSTGLRRDLDALCREVGQRQD